MTMLCNIKSVSNLREDDRKSVRKRRKRIRILNLQNRVVQNDFTLRVTNLEIFIEILL